MNHDLFIAMLAQFGKTGSVAVGTLKTKIAEAVKADPASETWIKEGLALIAALNADEQSV